MIVSRPPSSFARGTENTERTMILDTDYRGFTQDWLGILRSSKQASLFHHSSTPTPAAASHRLPPSEALERTRYTVYSSPHSYRGIFEGMSKIHRLEGGRNVRSRFPRIGDHNARALGWSGEQEMGAGKLAYQDHLVFPAVS